MTALVSVIDPEVHCPITELNMMNPKDVTINGSSVGVKIPLAAAGYSLRNTIAADVKSAPGALKGVEDITVEMDVMSGEQKKALREKLNGGHLEKEIPFAQPDSLVRVIAVASDEGRVGKSSTTVNPTAAMAKPGLKVGVMDAGIYGFSTPRMLGITHEPQVIDGIILPPLGA